MDDFADSAMEAIIKDLGIKGAIEQALPEGVTAHTRTDGKSVYLFVENYTENIVENISLGERYTDMLTGEIVDKISLNGYDIRISKR